jgi:sortase A
MDDSHTVSVPRRSRMRRMLRIGLRVGESTLAIAGAACLLAYAGACARASYTQNRESAAFDEAVRLRMEERLRQIQEESPNHRDWSPARVAKYEASLETPVRALGRLEIPDVDISVMVLEGTDETQLDRAVGHIEGTARPGEAGNLGIAGHRDGYFRGLRHIEPGASIKLTTLDGVAYYEVAKIDVVAPASVEVLQPTAEPTLTLVTCYPFYYVGDAPKRYVVHARRVAYDAWPSSSSRSGVAAR